MLELPDKSSKVWSKFFKENKSLVYRYIVNKIQHGMRHNLPKVNLFKFKNSSTVTLIEESDYIYMMSTALKIFIEVEEYETASGIKKFLDQYHIDKLIKDSNEV